MSHDSSDLFLTLTPERVLDAVEASGVEANPVCYPLNSFENRVYEVELADRTRVVAKFYRPGRWTAAQILEEHDFLFELEAEEIPVCAPRKFPDGLTLHSLGHIHYCLFDRRGGRAPDELTDADVERLGRLVARVHNVGARRPAKHRQHLDADAYVRRDLDWLEAEKTIPSPYATRYLTLAREIAELYERATAGVAIQRLHGDLHLGNVLFRDGLLRLLDFDDMMVGPPVQDVWLALPGRDTYTLRQREVFLGAYEELRLFDHSTTRLIEPLRGLRLIHYAAWIARRWHDPIFPATWTHFGTADYWERETNDLAEQLAVIRGAVAETEPDDRQGPGNGKLEEPELTNRDFFWDWDEGP